MLRRAVGAARHKARALLTQRMAECLTAPMRDRLDALVAVGDDHPHSPLHRIKTGSSNPSVGGMKRLLARLELIEATGVLEIDVGWVNGSFDTNLVGTLGTAVFIPPNARHALRCTGAEPLVFVFTFARERSAHVVCHFDNK